MNAIMEMGLSIAKFDESQLNQDFLDVDFNGAMMVRFEKSEGKWIAVNAVDGWGDNCREEVEGREGIVYLQSYALSHTEEKQLGEETPILVGHLNTRYGWNQFKVAEAGHPVYEFEDRYQITVESINPKGVPFTGRFYKDSFKHYIDFVEPSPSAVSDSKIEKE